MTRHDIHGVAIQPGGTVRRAPDRHSYRVLEVRSDGLETLRDDGQSAWLGATVLVEVDTGTPRPVGGVGDVAGALVDALPPGPVRDLIAERRARGIATYGQPLAVRGDGLDTMELLRPELADVLVYLARHIADIARSPTRPTDTDTGALALMVAGAIRVLGGSPADHVAYVAACAALAET